MSASIRDLKRMLVRLDRRQVRGWRASDFQYSRPGVRDVLLARLWQANLHYRNKHLEAHKARIAALIETKKKYEAETGQKLHIVFKDTERWW